MSIHRFSNSYSLNVSQEPVLYFICSMIQRVDCKNNLWNKRTNEVDILLFTNLFEWVFRKFLRNLNKKNFVVTFHWQIYGKIPRSLFLLKKGFQNLLLLSWNHPNSLLLTLSFPFKSKFQIQFNNNIAYETHWHFQQKGYSSNLNIRDWQNIKIKR